MSEDFEEGVDYDIKTEGIIQTAFKKYQNDYRLTEFGKQMLEQLQQEIVAEIKTEIDNYIVYVIKSRMDEYNSSVLFATLKEQLLGTESETKE